MEFLKNLFSGSKSVLIGASFILCTSGLLAQATFNNASHLLQNADAGSQITIGISDVNGDFRDDIIRMIDGVGFTVDYQTAFNETLIQRKLAEVSGGGEWLCLVGDLDNDYNNDFLTAGFYNGAKVFMNGGGTANFVKTQTSTTTFYSQGGNLADIDNDGFLDAFICNDDGLSKIFMNDGTGFFEDKSDLIDMNTVPSSDNSGNYASSFIDIDDDGDLDLFIAKCRIGAFSVTDPRRINALYINDNGTFTEQGEAFGMNSGAQSWSVDFGDVDNDGDLDCFIGNHGFHHFLLENINNTRFEEVQNFVDNDTIADLIIQSAFCDFDNDGFLDIVTSGEQSYLLHNNGDMTFSRIDNPFASSAVGSFALGDMNSDGFTDAIVTFGSVLSVGAGIEDRLYLNNGNDNNHFSISLRGVESNNSGIGAKIEIEGAWGKQIRRVKSGVSYNIFNSLTQRFGLGSATAIDKVTIYWPSGIIDSYTDVDINQQMIATEGQCITPVEHVELDGFTLLCPGDDAIVSTTSGNDINWSTGDQGQSVAINTAGFVNGQLTNQGCPTATETIYFGDVSESIPSISIDSDKEICIGDEVIVTSSIGNGITWSNGSTETTTSYTEEGPIYVTVDNNCGSIGSDTFQLTVAFPELNPYSETILKNTATDLFAEGDSISWFEDEQEANLIATGNTFNTGILQSDTTFYVKRSEIISTPLFDGGETISNVDENNKFSADQVNGGLFFKVHKNCILESVLIDTDKLGQRLIQISRGFDVVYEKLVDIVTTGEQRIILNAPLIQDNFQNYLIRTDQQTNIDNFGHNGCRFSRIDTGGEYPYQITDLISIENSEFGPLYYHHYFDWKVKADVPFCESLVVPFDVEIDLTNVEDNELSDITVFPNPMTDVLKVQSPKNINSIELYDLTGKLISKKENKKQVDFNTDKLESGVYLLKLRIDDRVLSKKMIKQ